MEWSIYSHIYYSKCANNYLLYSSLSNKLIELNEESYQDILKIKENPNLLEEYSDYAKALIEGRFVVESNKQEQNKITLTSLNQRFNNQSLSLTIAPTRACNFACPYCYEENRENTKMSVDIQKKIITFVKNFSDVKNLFVTWYGGEPTLSFSIIKKLTKDLQECVENYSAFMVTNGYRLNRIIEDLDALKIKGIQVTLDGTESTHNSTRKLVNGRGTFDTIIANLDLLAAKTKVNVGIRMNISKENGHQYAELQRLIQDRYPANFRLYPAFVHDYNGGCAAGSCYDDCNQKALFLKELFEKERLYTKDIYPFRMPKGCMSQKMNAYVIGPWGELYKCWHHIGVTDKVIGNISDSQYISDYGKLADLMVNNDCLTDRKCKECVLFPSCWGGCADDRDRKDNFCIPAKAMLEDFIDIHYHVKKTLQKQTKKRT